MALNATNVGGTLGQSQNAMPTIGGTNSSTRSIINMTSQQQQQQVIENHLNTTMEVDTGVQSTVMSSHHTTSTGTTMSHMNSSPVPGLGNLQSVVGPNNSISTSTVLTSTHSPLTTALQGGINTITPSSASSSSLGTQVKSSTSTTTTSHEALTQILTRPRLQDLVREVDPTEQLDEEVEELLLQLADDFVETTVGGACLLAKHRKANTVEVKDVQLHLERSWNMWVPGFGTDELRPYKRSSITEAHKQRLALIRKALKKY